MTCAAASIVRAKVKFEQRDPRKRAANPRGKMKFPP